MSNMIPLEQVRWRLGTVWFAGAALLFALLIVQSLANVHEDHVQAVWGWLLPNIVPTLSLMIGVFAAAALREEVETDSMRVRAPFAKLAIALSIFHLAAVAATFLAQPFVGTVSGAESRPMAIFETSNLWLGPLQGLVAAVIGALFFSPTNKRGESAPNPEASFPPAK